MSTPAGAIKPKRNRRRARRSRSAPKKRLLNAKLRTDFYQHLAMQVGNGVDVVDATEDYLARLKRRNMKRAAAIIHDVSNRLKDGKNLSAALSNYVKDEDLIMIASGDQSGELPAALELAVGSSERLNRIRQSVLSKLTAPLMYLLALWVLLYVVGHSVVPQLAHMLPPQKWHGLAYLLYLMGVVTTGWTSIVVPVAAVVVVVAVILSLPRWTGRSRIVAERYAKYVLPGLGMIYPLYRDLQGYAWLVSFTSLLRAGMDNVEALKSQERYATPWLAERLRAARRRMENGQNLGYALAGPSHGKSRRRRTFFEYEFPNADMIDDIISFVDFPDFPVKITVVADKWAERTEKNVNALGNMMNLATTGMLFMVFVIVQLGANEISSQLSSSFNGMM